MGAGITFPHAPNGGGAEATKPAMVIVPRGGNLVAEVKLLNKDAGFVRVGEPVTIKLEAFPFTRHGTIAGPVESISSDAVPDDKPGLIYVIRIALDHALLSASGIAQVSAPGTSATADAMIGRHSISAI